jgi:hypothetical protein
MRDDSALNEERSSGQRSLSSILLRASQPIQRYGADNYLKLIIFLNTLRPETRLADN